MKVELKYKIGEEIEWDKGKLPIIGFEYIEGRGLRYIVLVSDGVKFSWEYLFDFEIETLKIK